MASVAPPHSSWWSGSAEDLFRAPGRLRAPRSAGPSAPRSSGGNSITRAGNNYSGRTAIEGQSGNEILQRRSGPVDGQWHSLWRATENSEVGGPSQSRLARQQLGVFHVFSVEAWIWDGRRNSQFFGTRERSMGKLLLPRDIQFPVSTLSTFIILSAGLFSNSRPQRRRGCLPLRVRQRSALWLSRIVSRLECLKSLQPLRARADLAFRCGPRGGGLLELGNGFGGGHRMGFWIWRGTFGWWFWVGSDWFLGMGSVLSSIPVGWPARDTATKHPRLIYNGYSPDELSSGRSYAPEDFTRARATDDSTDQARQRRINRRQLETPNCQPVSAQIPRIFAFHFLIYMKTRRFVSVGANTGDG